MEKVSIKSGEVHHPFDCLVITILRSLSMEVPAAESESHDIVPMNMHNRLQNKCSLLCSHMCCIKFANRLLSHFYSLTDFLKQKWSPLAHCRALMNHRTPFQVPVDVYNFLPAKQKNSYRMLVRRYSLGCKQAPPFRQGLYLRMIHMMGDLQAKPLTRELL